MKLQFGALEKTRTSTTLRSLAPEASASTNSATRAGAIERDKRKLSPGQFPHPGFISFYTYDAAKCPWITP